MARVWMIPAKSICPGLLCSCTRPSCVTCQSAKLLKSTTTTRRWHGYRRALARIRASAPPLTVPVRTVEISQGWRLGTGATDQGLLRLSTEDLTIEPRCQYTGQQEADLWPLWHA